MFRVERRELYALIIDSQKPLPVEEARMYRRALDHELAKADEATEKDQHLEAREHLANALWAVAMLNSSAALWNPSVAVIFPSYLDLVEIPPQLIVHYVRSRSNSRRSA